MDPPPPLASNDDNVFEPQVILRDDPVERLFREALYHQVLQNRNPYLTYETLVLRILKRVGDLAGLNNTFSFSSSSSSGNSSNTAKFCEWHDEIRVAYEMRRKNLGLEEQTCVERVLARDSPHPSELVKFATCWMKHDPATVCRWFAVDGTLGLHPKFYVHEAFSTCFEGHVRAVRALYSSSSSSDLDSPESVGRVIREAFARVGGGGGGTATTAADDPDLSRHVELYVQMAGEEEVCRVRDDRRSKQQQQQQSKTAAAKRKKTPAAAAAAAGGDGVVADAVGDAVDDAGAAASFVSMENC